MIPLKQFDKVTVAVDGALVHGRVTSNDPLFYRVERVGNVGGFLGDMLPSEEGYRWLRGHVDGNDEAGRALLTINVLRAS